MDDGDLPAGSGVHHFGIDVAVGVFLPQRFREVGEEEFVLRDFLGESAFDFNETGHVKLQ